MYCSLMWTCCYLDYLKRFKSPHPLAPRVFQRVIYVFGGKRVTASQTVPLIPLSAF